MDHIETIQQIPQYVLYLNIIVNTPIIHVTMITDGLSLRFLVKVDHYYGLMQTVSESWYVRSSQSSDHCMFPVPLRTWKTGI